MTMLLRGGTVIDGTGAPRRTADVRVDGERIVAINADLPTAGAAVIDASGCIVAPGFIDVHTHDDRIVLAQPQMLPKISQVTTVAPHGLVAQIRGGPSVYFGDDTQLEQKWIAASEVLGDPGRHTRAAVGANALPRGVSVEIAAVVVVRTKG